MVTKITPFNAPTEVDHSQIRRRVDIYIRPVGEDLGRLSNGIDKIIQQTALPNGVKANVRGSVEAMNASFRSFAVGLILSVGLLYLILVAQFRSFLDPFIILLALPPGIMGVMMTLTMTGTTLNVMSLMGLIMLAGIVTSNSILIVEFAHRLIEEGLPIRESVAKASRVRLRPILMTSLATIIGLLPMALKLGEGSESYAPLARALVGGLMVSALVTVFIVPAGFYRVYGGKYAKASEPA
jgi:multidrug efflux pump subunit AcrB